MDEHFVLHIGVDIFKGKALSTCTPALVEHLTQSDTASKVDDALFVKF